MVERLQNNNNVGNVYSHSQTSVPIRKKAKSTYSIKPQPVSVKCKKDIMNEMASYDVLLYTFF